VVRFGSEFPLMGRPKNAPKPPKATRKSTTKTPAPCAKVKLRPLPAKGDIKSLAAHRFEFSKKLLGNRLRQLNSEDLALFMKLTHLGERQIRRIKQPVSPTRVPHDPEVREVALMMWQDMVDDLYHKATAEKLQEKLVNCKQNPYDIPIGTLQRWISQSPIFKPTAPPQERESNQPEIHWKLVSSQKR